MAFQEDHVKQRCQVHFQVLEGVVCKFGDKVGIQYILSSTNIWTDREGQHDYIGYVEDVRDASTKEMGGVPSIG